MKQNFSSIMEATMLLSIASAVIVWFESEIDVAWASYLTLAAIVFPIITSLIRGGPLPDAGVKNGTAVARVVRFPGKPCRFASRSRWSAKTTKGFFQPPIPLSIFFTMNRSDFPVYSESTPGFLKDYHEAQGCIRGKLRVLCI
jgi:hypothetical protein